MADGVTFPGWLHALSVASLLLAALCSLIIVLDEVRRPQTMWIMAIVWPVTAWFGSVLWLAAYYAWGRAPKPGAEQDEVSFAAMVHKGASHCGAGCTLGDIIVEWLCWGFPVIATWFGWHGWTHEKMIAVWLPDYLVAFLLGVLFQYFTIAPMRGLSLGEGVVAAAKADILSITSWQIGMYGAMAALQLGWLRSVYGHAAEVDSPVFWFVMQIAMLAGFCTAYPVNWWLIRAGFKEKM